MFDTFKVLETLKQAALDNGIIEQYFDTQIHSAHVYSLAKELISNINARRTRRYVFEEVVKPMCFGHDAGRMITGSKASKELMPAIVHGYEGAMLLKGRFFDYKIARCCETHICGTGLATETKKEKNIKSVFRVRNLSLEEKIVSYADLLTFSRKNDSPTMPYLPYRASLKQAYERVKEFGEAYVERLDNLVDELFFEVTKNMINGQSLDEIDFILIPKQNKPKTYDFETKKCADILRENTVNHVKSGKEGNILIKEFRKGDCHSSEGEYNWKIELTPIGLCEHMSYWKYAAGTYPDPEDEHKSDECIPLDKFERIVEKYNLK